MELLQVLTLNLCGFDPGLEAGSRLAIKANLVIYLVPYVLGSCKIFQEITMLFLQRTIKNVEMFYGSGQIFFPLGISNGSKNIGDVRMRICPSDDFIMLSTSH